MPEKHKDLATKYTLTHILPFPRDKGPAAGLLRREFGRVILRLVVLQKRYRLGITLRGTRITPWGLLYRRQCRCRRPRGASADRA